MVTLVCYCSDFVQQWYYAHLYNAIVKLADISILSLMELYLESGVIVKLAHAVFLFLPRLYLGMSFVVKLAYLNFLYPSGLYLGRCCVA